MRAVDRRARRNDRLDAWRRRLAWTGLFGSIVLAACAPATLGQGDGREADERYWPRWRGPRMDGTAPRGNPPTTWSETENVCWKRAIDGAGLSSPIVWKDRIYLTTAIPVRERDDPEAAAEAEAQVPEWRRESGIAPMMVLDFTVLALDRDTGEEVWRTVVRQAAPHEGLHTDSTWASASPVTNGKVLVAGFGSHGIYALDLDGKVLWERDLGDMTTRRGFGEGSSPTIWRDKVVVNWDHEGPSFITVLDLATGETVWKTERDEVTSWSTPVVAEVGGKPQVVVNATGRTRGYDLASGDVIWEAAGMTVNTIPTPIWHGDRVYVASGYRGAMLQAIDLPAARGDITGKPAIAWQVEEDTPYVPSMLLSNGRLYVTKHFKGILSVYDAQTGEKHYGPVRLEGIDGLYASPVAAAGRVYYFGRGGTALVLKDGPTYEVLATNELDDDVDASPAIVGDQLFVRGRKKLYCIGPTKKR